METSAPDQPLAVQPIRRSLTLPSRLGPRAGRTVDAFEPETSSDATQATLFTHSSVKIVHFTPPASSTQPISTSFSSDHDYPIDAIETLPWRSPTERTIALAPLKLEKVAGSAAFLKCGSVVRPILKNSQCWCVDGKSVFVLRIQRLVYYRIELPAETVEDEAKISELKAALSQILRYENTPCPFQRGFTVALPEEAKTPKRKRAWRPKTKAQQRREGSPSASSPQRTGSRGSDSDRNSAEDDTDSNYTDDSAATPRGSRLFFQEDERSSPINIPRRNLARNFTEPPQTFTSLVAKFQPIPESGDEAELSSLASSIDSFHSFQTSLSYLNPSPPVSTSHSLEGLSPPEPLSASLPIRRHCRDVSEITVTPHTLETEPLEPAEIDILPELDIENRSVSSSSSLSVPSPSTSEPTPDEDGKVVRSPVDIADPNSDIRRRLKASRKRDLSPLPPQSTLFHPAPRNPSNHLTASILQKTCTVVLGPPLQFLVMLVHIASRIAVSKSDGDDARSPSPGDFEDPHLSEDDFGVPLNMTGAWRNSFDNPPRSPAEDPWDLD